MARMYPTELSSQVSRDPKHAAEVKLFRQLRNQLGNDWIVFYSVAWIGRFRTDGALHDGETDFIVAHPQRGVLLIEVKGGRISYEGSRSQWSTTDRDGCTHNINPFSQVKKCKYDLRDKIRSLPGWGQEDVRLGHAVAFPDSVVRGNVSLPPEAPAELIIDAHDLDRLPQRLESIMHDWRSHESAGTSLSMTGESFIETLIGLLAPTTTLPNPLSVQIADQDREILLLTAEQFRLLGFLSRTRRAAIAGAAGSGKTLMAVEKAKRLAQEGFRVLLACYNDPLAAHLTMACAETVDIVGRDNLFVGTFHDWCAYVGTSAGLSVPATVSSGGLDAYADVLFNGIQIFPNLRMDAIIIDEGQDMEELWWIALTESLSNKVDSVFYVFFDDNQKVKQGAPIPDDLELQAFPLRENVRNTRAIHKLASGFYKGTGPSEPRGPSGRSVEAFEYTDAAGLRKQLTRLLHRFINVEDLRPDQIVLLTPWPLNQSKLPGILQSLGTEQREVKCTSIENFKGLEQSVVIVAELDGRFASLSEDEREALSYVATSRPRNHLALLGDPGVLNSLLSRAIR